MEADQDEIDRINKQLADLRGSSRAADGSVIIETDPTGRITYLYIADYAMENGPDRLAALIIDRHRAAMNGVETKVVGLFESLPAPGRSSTAPPHRQTTSAGEDLAEFTYTPSHLRRD